jgi:hypothetical protein
MREPSIHIRIQPKLPSGTGHHPAKGGIPMSKPSPPRLKLALAAALSLLALQIGICQNPPETDPRLVGTWQAIRSLMRVDFSLVPGEPAPSEFLKVRVTFTNDGKFTVQHPLYIISGLYWTKTRKGSMSILKLEYEAEEFGKPQTKNTECLYEVKDGLLYWIYPGDLDVPQELRLRGLPSSLEQVLNAKGSFIWVMRRVPEKKDKP